MTTQQPNFVQAIGQILKGIVVLVLVGLFAWACLSQHTGTTTPTTPPSPSNAGNPALTTKPSSTTPTPALPPTDLITPKPQTYTPAPTWSPGEADFLIGIHSALSDWQFTNDPGNDAALVDLGYNTCKTLLSGMSEPDVIDALRRYGPTATLPELDRRIFVHSAEVYICPRVHVAP